MRKILICLLLALSLIGCSSQKTSEKTADNLEEVDLILDWVPNTNHTGLLVASEKGFDTKRGVKLNVKRPPEGSTSDLVATGKAPLGISFQDSIAPKLDKGINLTIVAAIIEHNTAGLLIKKDPNFKSIKDLEHFRYGTWDDPIEKAIVELAMVSDGGDFSKVKLVPNQADNAVIGIANNMFDAATVYYAWDGILAKYEHVDCDFLPFANYNPALDYYVPVIIANNDYIKEHKDTLKKVMQAIKEGYEYAMSNPKEAAEILIKYAPEIADKKDFVLQSQEYLAKAYAKNPKKWGQIDKNRFNAFYSYLFEKGLTQNDLSKKDLFTNDFVE